MSVHGKHYRTIWLKEDAPNIVQISTKPLVPEGEPS